MLIKSVSPTVKDFFVGKGFKHMFRYDYRKQAVVKATVNVSQDMLAKIRSISIIQ